MNTPIIIKKQATPAGHEKTVCVTAVLTALGVAVDSFRHTWNSKNKVNVWEGILRRHGFAVRSRRSKLRKATTVGQARQVIAKISADDPTGTKYIVRVKGHVMLLDGSGATIVDTAPRMRDRRTIVDIFAVW